VLALNILRDRLHRARAKERHHRVDVVDGRGLELFEVARHARAVELEGAFGLAAREHLECFFVIDGDVFDIDR
jgi:hypothetical protein